MHSVSRGNTSKLVFVKLYVYDMEHERLTIFTVAAAKSDGTCTVIATWYVIAHTAILTGSCNNNRCGCNSSSSSSSSTVCPERNGTEMFFFGNISYKTREILVKFGAPFSE